MTLQNEIEKIIFDDSVDLDKLLNDRKYRTKHTGRLCIVSEKQLNKISTLIQDREKKTVMGFVEYVSSLELPKEGIDILSVEGVRIINELLFRKVDEYLMDKDGALKKWQHSVLLEDEKLMLLDFAKYVREESGNNEGKEWDNLVVEEYLEGKSDERSKE